MIKATNKWWKIENCKTGFKSRTLAEATIETNEILNSIK